LNDGLERRGENGIITDVTAETNESHEISKVPGHRTRGVLTSKWKWRSSTNKLYVVIMSMIYSTCSSRSDVPTINWAQS
jgi:hypothetical protein